MQDTVGVLPEIFRDEAVSMVLKTHRRETATMTSTLTRVKPVSASHSVSQSSSLCSAECRYATEGTCVYRVDFPCFGELSATLCGVASLVLERAYGGSLSKESATGVKRSQSMRQKKPRHNPRQHKGRDDTSWTRCQWLLQHVIVPLAQTLIAAIGPNLHKG